MRRITVTVREPGHPARRITGLWPSAMDALVDILDHLDRTGASARAAVCVKVAP